ncbi:MAG: NifU family protein [Chloroflexota bacterium]|nr:NifU family protein [Chloroflexota bacterium]
MTDAQPGSALTPPDNLAELSEWIDGLIQDFAEHPDAGVRERVFALLDGVDALHRAALGRLTALLRAPGAEAVWARARNDQVVRTVLLLYDLLPQSEREGAEGALEAVFPYIESHGGKLELLAVAEGVVTVRLSGSCQDCSGSTVTLKRVVEGALRDGLAGFRELRVEHPPAPPRPPVPAPAKLAAGQLGGKRALPVLAAQAMPPAARAPQWHDAATLDDLPPGTLSGVRVAGEAVLLCNAGGDIFAYRDACPDTPLALALGQFDGEAIVCPWHGCRFAARTGRRLVHRGTGLASFPVAIEGKVIRVAVNVPGPAFNDSRHIVVSNRS